MLVYMAKSLIWEKRKPQRYPVSTAGFYSSQITDISACKHVQNLLKTLTPLNVISACQKSMSNAIT